MKKEKSEKEIKKIGQKEFDSVMLSVFDQKNEKRAIFNILLFLMKKLKNKYDKIFFYTYIDKLKLLAYAESVYDFESVSPIEIEKIHELASEQIDLNRDEKLYEKLKLKETSFFTEKDQDRDSAPLLKYLKKYQVAPIKYGNSDYGALILSPKDGSVIQEEVGEEILDVFRYMLSMYFYNKKLEKDELEEERLRTIGHFANTMVHEFRTPIAVIKGLAKLAKSKLGDEDKLIEYLESISKEADRITEIAMEVGKYASVEKEVLYLEYFNIKEAISEELLLNKEAFEKRKIAIQGMDFPDDEEYYGNKDNFMKAIGHILKNSIENVDYSKEKRYIYINYLKSDEKLVICDNGCGINKKHMERIQNPFFTTKLNGTGLGLTIVTEYFKRQGIKVDIESEKGMYTKVTLSKEGR